MHRWVGAWNTVRMLLLLITFTLINICPTVIIGSWEPELWRQSEMASNRTSPTYASMRHWPSYPTSTCFLIHKIWKIVLPTSCECLAQREKKNPSAVPTFIIFLLNVISQLWIKESRFGTWNSDLWCLLVNAKLWGMSFIPVRPALFQGSSGPPGLSKVWNIRSPLPSQGDPGLRSLARDSPPTVTSQCISYTI